MKILYHHRTLGDGAEGIHIREMIKAFRGLGHEVRVAALVGEDAGSGAAPDGRQRRWARLTKFIPESAYELAELGYNVVGGRRVAEAIRQFRPDFVYDRYNSYCTAAVAPARRNGVPVILEVNAPVAYERSAYEKLNLRFPKLAERYEARICRMADHVFAVSTPLRDFLVEQRGVPPDRITVLPNGADPRVFRPELDGCSVRARHGLGDRQVIGFVGILRPWHGLELLLEAFEQLNPREGNAHLLLVGDGPSEEPLRRQAKELNLSDRVTFTGRVPHEDIREHVAAMDVAVSPRATFYASPMKILEYMAMGKAVVAPRMPNIGDILEDREEGLLFTPEDPAALGRALRTLMNERELARRLGRQARRTVERKRNWVENARVVLSQVQSLENMEHGVEHDVQPVT